MSILTNLWSWSFLAGLVAGFVLNRAIALVRVCWLERHRPLPDGRHRSKWQALSFDRRWLIGLLAIAFLGWSVITTSENEKISADNDRLSQEERQLLADLARYQAEWLGRILDPPAEVKALERGSPVRERYNLDVILQPRGRSEPADRRDSRRAGPEQAGTAEVAAGTAGPVVRRLTASTRAITAPVVT